MKKVMVGYTYKGMSPIWTLHEELNLTAVVHKHKFRAAGAYREVKKVRITVEEISTYRRR